MWRSCHHIQTLIMGNKRSRQPPRCNSLKKRIVVGYHLVKRASKVLLKQENGCEYPNKTQHCTLMQLIQLIKKVLYIVEIKTVNLGLI